MLGGVAGSRCSVHHQILIKLKHVEMFMRKVISNLHECLSNKSRLLFTCIFFNLISPEQLNCTEDFPFINHVILSTV